MSSGFSAFSEPSDEVPAEEMKTMPDALARRRKAVVGVLDTLQLEAATSIARHAVQGLTSRHASALQLPSAGEHAIM